MQRCILFAICAIVWQEQTRGEEYKPRSFAPLIEYRHRQFEKPKYKNSSIVAKEDQKQETDLRIQVPVPIEVTSLDTQVLLHSDVRYNLGSHEDDFAEDDTLSFYAHTLKKVPGQNHSYLLSAGFVRKDFTRHLLNQYIFGVTWKGEKIFWDFVLTSAIVRVRTINHRYDFTPMFSLYRDLGSGWELRAFFPQELSVARLLDNYGYQLGLKSDSVTNMVLDRDDEDFWLTGFTAQAFTNISYNLYQQKLWGTFEIGTGLEYLEIYDNAAKKVNTRQTPYRYYAQLALRALN